MTFFCHNLQAKYHSVTRSVDLLRKKGTVIKVFWIVTLCERQIIYMNTLQRW